MESWSVTLTLTSIELPLLVLALSTDRYRKSEIIIYKLDRKKQTTKQHPQTPNKAFKFVDIFIPMRFVKNNLVRIYDVSCKTGVIFETFLYVQKMSLLNRTSVAASHTKHNMFIYLYIDKYI